MKPTVGGLWQDAQGQDQVQGGALKMNPSDYKAAALRTEHTPDFVRLAGASVGENIKIARLLHALLGLASEVGEIADAIKKRIIYGKPVDEVNLVEEHGDESWYMSIMLDALGSTWEESWQKNIAKLKVRFPDKFTEAAALTRDLTAERRALEAPRTVLPPGPPGLAEALAASARTRETPSLCGAPTGTHGRDDCQQTVPCSMHGSFGSAAPAPTALPVPAAGVDHLPWKPCKHCDDTICVAARALIAERDAARADAATWKRRAEQHGCNVVDGDPDCG